MLVLSLFPGVGLLDSAFEAEGFCVVRGPDLLWGGDVRRFHPPAGVFDGIIGGPPCQDFSSARRCEPTGYGAAMLAEFSRVVQTARPAWWLCENVDAVPDVRIAGYSWQRTDIEQAWYVAVRRLRHVQFGSLNGAVLEVPAGIVRADAEPAALACDCRSLDELKRLQGLPDSFELPGFTLEESKRAIGNGVPIVMGRVLARAVRAAMCGEPACVDGLYGESLPVKRCVCGCGRRVASNATYDNPACRKRAQWRRERDRTSAMA